MKTKLMKEIYENPDLSIGEEGNNISAGEGKSVVEKRIFQRMPIDTFVVIDMQMHGKTKNLSAGGMSIIIPIHIEKGTMLHINFSLPGDRSVNLFGNIMWIKSDGGSKYECGIEFIEFADHNRRIIREHVEKNCSGEHLSCDLSI